MGVAAFGTANEVVSIEERKGAWPPIGAKELEAIQFEQFQHDEAFHREISRLTVQRRLTHMTLHFAKYAGYLAEGADDDKFRRTVTDLFVIGVSTINGLNLRIHSLLAGIGRPSAVSPEELAREVTIRAGRMASACERLDHLEDFPYRTTIRDAAVELIALALSVAEDRGWSIPELVEDRLRPVKAKSIFYDQLV